MPATSSGNTAASNGALYISLGKQQSSDYTDTNGVTWWTDMLTGTPDYPALFPTNAFSQYVCPGTWSGTVGSTALQIFNQGMIAATSDVHFDVWVPSGTHTAALYLANPCATTTGQAGFRSNARRERDRSQGFIHSYRGTI